MYVVIGVTRQTRTPVVIVDKRNLAGNIRVKALCLPLTVGEILLGPSSFTTFRKVGERRSFPSKIPEYSVSLLHFHFSFNVQSFKFDQYRPWISMQTLKQYLITTTTSFFLLPNTQSLSLLAIQPSIIVSFCVRGAYKSSSSGSCPWQRWNPILDILWRFPKSSKYRIVG